MKELTLILPDETDYVDITYYWRDTVGMVKTCVCIDAKKQESGDKITCYKQPEWPEPEEP